MHNTGKELFISQFDIPWPLVIDLCFQMCTVPGTMPEQDNKYPGSPPLLSLYLLFQLAVFSCCAHTHVHIALRGGRGGNGATSSEMPFAESGRGPAWALFMQWSRRIKERGGRNYRHEDSRLH